MDSSGGRQFDSTMRIIVFVSLIFLYLHLGWKNCQIALALKS